MPLNKLSVDDIEKLEKIRWIDLIGSDNETERLMNKVLAQSVVFLNLLEKEKFLLDHYDYLMLNIEQRNHQQRLANLETSIREATQELANINRRETCEKPFWKDSHRVTVDVEENAYSTEYMIEGGDTTRYSFHTFFAYLEEAPIARIKLDAGHEFSYSKTWWDPERSENRHYISGGAYNLLRMYGLPALGVYELTLLGCTAFFSRCQFTEMNLQGETTRLNCMKSWEMDIQLPEHIEARHSQFNVKYEGFGSGVADCYYREPKVTIYTRICDMHGNPERIAGLNDFITLLQQQRREIQQSYNTQSQLELMHSSLQSCHDEIEQHRELMFILAKVCTPLQAASERRRSSDLIHENIKKFLQFWQQRENRNANALTSEVHRSEVNEFKGFFKKNCSTLFRDGQHSFVVQRTRPERLAIKTNYPRTAKDNESFHQTRHSFVRFISTAYPGYRQFTKNEPATEKCVYFEIRGLDNYITSYLLEGRSIKIERNDLTITDEEWRALKDRIRNRECHGLEVLMEAAAKKGLIPEKKEEVWALQGNPLFITQVQCELESIREETGSNSCIMS